MGLKHPLPSLTIESVLFVPNCTFNLFFVHRLTQTHDLVITFIKNSVILQEQISWWTIGVGCESHGLYYLSGSPQVCFSIISPLTIHAQLGHPGLPTLQKMVPNLHQLSSLHCDSCQFGIHTRSSFPSRVNKRAASSFALVDLDVWGPSRVITPTGFKYFVTFIDGFSRYTWLWLTKNNPELFSIFEKIYNEIKTQFGIPICCCRSDNVREYLINFSSLWRPKASFIKHLMPILHNKWGCWAQE